MAPLVPQIDPSSCATEELTLETLVQKIHTILGPDGGLDSDHIDPNEIIQLMEEYNSNAKDWSKYAIFDHSRAYTRNLIDDGNGKFNLMILAWSKGQQSPIHNHAGSHCIMKVLDGELHETQYAWPSEEVSRGDSTQSTSMPLPQEAVSDITAANIRTVEHAESDASGKPLTVTNHTSLRPNGVTYIHDKIGLHRIANPDLYQGAVSLHLYTPPYQVCKTFEERSGRARVGGKCTFYSVGGVRCADEQPLSSSLS
ncbi:RmlC-like cupin domain-containing protein [Dichotomocladium elegans]|nr:RmlC-like cupin domain-containing protein [Dichotomocladium elegans]